MAAVKRAASRRVLRAPMRNGRNRFVLPAVKGHAVIEGTMHRAAADRRDHRPGRGVHPLVRPGNNIVGEGLVGAARQLRLTIPRDVSILVFDDPPWTSLLDPPITVVQQPMRDLGITAATQLISPLQGTDSPSPLGVLPTQLIIRGSTIAPR